MYPVVSPFLSNRMIHDSFDFIRYILYGVSEYPLDTTAFFVKSGLFIYAVLASLKCICIINPSRALMFLLMVHLNQPL
ncbi:hypothetical protein BDV32DRAFT_88470 [Aspergillus pseudonomiae]|nr:hypothetical protein BDV32DRAFT_88470 [Aspergillus pseudonomiae]